jgi:hypothetical protein
MMAEATSITRDMRDGGLRWVVSHYGGQWHWVTYLPQGDGLSTRHAGVAFNRAEAEAKARIPF